MNKNTKRIIAFFMAVVMVIGLYVTKSPKNILAEDGSANNEEEYYLITNYNSNGNIKGSISGTLSGKGYCIDYKLTPPSGTEPTFTRVKLSELTSYTKSYKEKGVTYTNTVALTDEAKIRLLKLLVARSEIEKYAQKNTITEADKKYIVDGVVDNSITVSLSICPKSLRELYENGEITEASFRTQVRDRLDSELGDLMSDSYIIQYFIWACVHDSSEWSDFVKDNGTTTGKKDHYYHNESRFYYSDDPINDTHSLWNVYYKKVINYIDNLPDYFAQGYDAWVYVTDKQTTQNILGAPFKQVGVKIVKRNSSTYNKLDGAVLQLLDHNKNVVAEWTTDSNANPTSTLGEFDNLVAGDYYYIHEVKAPYGFDKLENDIQFSVDVDGSIHSNVSRDNGTLYVDNTETSFSVLKVDETGNTLSGANLSVYDIDGKSYSWTSSRLKKYIYLSTLHISADDTTVSVYLSENKAANGYVCPGAAQREFDIKINADGVIESLSLSGTPVIASDGSTHYVFDDGFEWYLKDDKTIAIVNKRPEISISKVDIADGSEISGATLSLYDSTNQLIEEWISDGSKHIISNLNIDEKYTLSETVAPEGYLYTTDIEFEIDQNGNIITQANVSNGTLLVEDTITSVDISKRDIANDEELEGAVIKIIGNADWQAVINRLANDEHNVNMYIEGGKVLGITYTSTDKPLKLSGLLLDTVYEMIETTAPEGYLYSEDIVFKLVQENDSTVVYIENEDGSFSKSSGVVMYDEADLGNLVITKSVDGLNVTDEEKAGALKFTVCDDKGNYLDENGILSSDEKLITLDKFTKDSDGRYVLTFTNIPSGTYTVTETNSEVEGYNLVSTSVTSGNATVSYNDTATIELKDSYEKITDISDTTDISITSDTSSDTAPKTGDKGYLNMIMLMTLAGGVVVFTSKKKQR